MTRTPPTPFPTPPYRRRSIHDGSGPGVSIAGNGTRGRLEGCDLVRNWKASLHIREGADPTVVACR